jgi:hypothetical protein
MRVNRASSKALHKVTNLHLGLTLPYPLASRHIALYPP